MQWESFDEELPDIAENIPHQISDPKRSRQSSSRSSRGSFSSLSRSPSPSSKPSAALPQLCGAQLYREVIQGIKDFRPQEELKELSPRNDESPPESTEVLAEDDWLVDDLAEIRAEKAEKKRKRLQSPVRYSSPSPERYSSNSKRNASPPKSSRVSKLSKV